MSTTTLKTGGPSPLSTRASGLSPTSPRKAAAAISRNLVLGLVGLFFLIPMLWLVFASLNPTANLTAELPESLSFENFTAIFNAETSFVPMWNSVLLSAGSAAITVVAAVLAAYPLSRYNLRFNRSFMYTILFATGLPITAMMVPVYSLFVITNQLDSMGSTIFFMAATSLPMAIWMTKNFMDDVPLVLEEAAWIDGASMLRTLWSVVVPLMRPGLGVVFVYVFIHAWGNFFIPFLLLLSPEKQPAAVSIFNFFGEYGTVAYGQLAAFSLLYSVPVVALYVIVNSVTGNGFATAGGVKG